MKSAMQARKLKTLPQGYYLQKLFNSETFMYMKVEMEGNQYHTDVDDDPEYYEDRILENAGIDRDELQYIQAYNDGSVNTEITFTVRLSEHGVQLATRMMQAFGNDIENLENAGMHITLMPRGPYTREEPKLKEEGVRNIVEQITPILPFIQLLGQSKDIHRGAGYCKNMVGFNKQGYPAINVQDDKRIEFRFFHPCYNKPDLFRHYLEVIARILEFYEDPQRKVKLHGGTGTYRVLLDTSEFNNYASRNTSILPETLAFSDIFWQFTGQHVGAWREATGFTPKSLPQQWAKKEYKQLLRKREEQVQLANRCLPKDAAKWVTGDKETLYDEFNMKVLRTI